MTDLSTYEVTVPVTVTVRSDSRGNLTVTKVAFDDWGGFFSEAEEAAGVWHVDKGRWVHEDQEAIARTATAFVRRQVTPPAQIDSSADG